MLMAP
jgi:hypothetical protein